MPRRRTVSCQNCHHLLLKRAVVCEMCGHETERSRHEFRLWLARGALAIVAALLMVAFVQHTVASLSQTIAAQR
jgi:hypothetical protein